MSPVAVCVLTSGDYPQLAQQAIGSILEKIPDRQQYRMIVGANQVGARTLQYFEEVRTELDSLIISDVNLGKCPMMRRMFAHVRSEYIWWFDDDSFVISPQALEARLRIARGAEPSVVMWGEQYVMSQARGFCDGDPVAFVRTAPWYRALPPPFWAPGGKGEFDFEGKGTGDGRWIFLTGGGWFARTSSLRALDWPDPRLRTFGEDVFLGEALRQQGWRTQHIGALGVETNTAPRRWSADHEGASRPKQD